MKVTLVFFSVLSVLFVGSECSLRWKATKTSQPLPLPERHLGKPLILTKLINRGKIVKAQRLSLVKPSIGNTTSYSGYFTTNKTCGNNLFFWFFPAQEDWTNAPIVLWLQGGPGSASLYGLFQENGPFNSFPDGLQMRNYSWNVKNNLIYIDQPADTGYSFTKKKCYPIEQTAIGDELYSAITQFLKLFPKIANNKFFITGESYAGHFIPPFANTILGKNPTASSKINLAGLMIGGAWTDPREQINYGDFLYQTGLIGDKQLKQFYKLQKHFVNQVDEEDWKGAYDSWHDILLLCVTYAGLDLYNYLPHPADTSNYKKFLEMASTRKAIHVGSTKYDDQSGPVYNHLLLDMPKSVKPWVEEILEEIPIVFYGGQLDVIVGFPMMRNFLNSLNWSGQASFLDSTRTQWIEGGEISGYIRGANNLFEVMVRDAGHMVPQDQPFWAYQLVNNFTSGTGLFEGKLSKA